MSILGFSAADIVSILQLGISGVAFTFLAMSFVLLRKEQDREAEPRREILESIKSFSRLSLIFAVLVGVISIIQGVVTPSDSLSNQCSEAIDRAEVLASNRDAQTLDTLHSLLQTTISHCK